MQTLRSFERKGSERTSEGLCFASANLRLGVSCETASCKALRKTSKIRKLEKAVAVSGVCSEVPEETPGKSRENGWINLPESQNVTNSQETAANLRSTLPGLCPHLPCNVFLKSTVPAFSSFCDKNYCLVFIHSCKISPNNLHLKLFFWILFTLKCCFAPPSGRILLGQF